MGKVKNQHYVPRSYIKYFANKKEQIWVYDKQNDKSYLANITNVASQRYFYDIPFDEIKDILTLEENIKVIEILKEGNFASEEQMKIAVEQSVEKFFAEKIEGPFKKFLDKIRSRFTMLASPFESVAFTNDDRNDLSIMLAYQIVRSKEFRESHKDTIKAMTQSMVDVLAKSNDKNYELGTLVAVPKQEFDTLEHANIIFGSFPIQLAKVLSSHTWFISVNQTKLPFYTSDAPIVKRAHKIDSFFGTDGFGSPGIELAFPLSSKLILVMAEKTYHQDLLHLDRCFFPLSDEQNVVYYNSLQVFQSNRQVYSFADNFDLIREMRQKEGSLARKSKQVIVNSFLGEKIY